MRPFTRKTAKARGDFPNVQGGLDVDTRSAPIKPGRQGYHQWERAVSITRIRRRCHNTLIPAYSMTDADRVGPRCVLLDPAIFSSRLLLLAYPIDCHASGVLSRLFRALIFTSKAVPRASIVSSFAEESVGSKRRSPATSTSIPSCRRLARYSPVFPQTDTLYMF